MNKKRLGIITAILFLVQSLSILDEICAGTLPLSPPTKVSLNKSEPSFKNVYDIVHLSILLYKLDAVKRYSKDRIRETLLSDAEIARLGEFGIRFDFENIDIGKKGWTRYYPFSVDANRFIMRIFRTEERAYQPKVAVLFEDSMPRMGITFQILPCLNEILKECRIKAHNLYPASQATATSP